MKRRTLACACAAILAACGDGLPPLIDATLPDAALADSTAKSDGAGDLAVSADAVRDTSVDTVGPDAATPDLAGSDSAVADSAVADSAVADSAIADSAIADSAVADSAVADSAVPDPKGLILYYPFGGNATNQGLSGSAYDGTGSNVTYVAGVFGKAVKFNQSNVSFVKLPNTVGPLSKSYTYTIGLWFKEDTVVNGGGNRLIDFRKSGTVAGGIEAYHGASGSNLYTCASGTVGSIGCQSFAYSVGIWHHLLYRYQGTSTSAGGGADLEIYLDNVLVGTIVNQTNDVIFSSDQETNTMLGINSNFYIDDLKIYDKVFTEQEQCTLVIGGTWGSSGCSLP